MIKRRSGPPSPTLPRSRGRVGWGFPRWLAIEVCDGAPDRIHPVLDLRLCRAALGNQLIEPAIELGHGFDQLARRLLIARASCVGCADLRYFVELPAELVEPRIETGERLPHCRRLFRARLRLLEHVRGAILIMPRPTRILAFVKAMLPCVRIFRGPIVVLE